ncbi:hypothetical protein F4821DRAFT_220922 [Hypoxylon rubiginosum]|uniref:Uncharacterized protein n=1 Tax=Hypoxylon rubiginosum TaxID=110542 RepID=A0ACC0DL06_9PEZI|nr:hypothetical protein F4821DRAFT_220922 [Hypoxylon rubiginosum]
MLRRLIPRPTTKLVAAAAWPSILTAQLHGSSCQLQSPSSGQSSLRSEHFDSRNDDDGVEATTKKTPSLFAQLFPDEAKQIQRQRLDGLPKSAWASQTFDEPAPLAPHAPTSNEYHLEGEGEGEHEQHAQYDPKTLSSRTSLSHNGPPSTAENPLRAQSMLILSAASKQLLESDFVRLGRRGAHVEGWVAGIQRVVQARDPDTLSPLGHYFVLFDSDAAAAAYRDEVERLWQLARAPVPGARRKGRRVVSAPEEGAAVRSFTLVPPSLRYHLRQAAGRNGGRLDDFDLGGASFVDQLVARVGSKYLVLVTVDGGRMSVDTLRRAVEDDGVERHLPWRVKDLQNGILPFGKSVLKKHDVDSSSRDRDREIEQNLLDQVNRAIGRKGDEGDQDARDTGTNVDSTKTEDRKYRQYSRFIVPFTDGPEAHRFVRKWHRRQLTLRMNLGEDEASWEETRVFNTSVLW